MISVAFKSPLKTRLGICIYKASLLHRRDGMTILVSHQTVPPTFYNKIAAMPVPTQQQSFCAHNYIAVN